MKLLKVKIGGWVGDEWVFEVDWWLGRCLNWLVVGWMFELVGGEWVFEVVGLKNG